ncbi:MAG: hypothetical protein GX951_00605 [Mollicutes bacterium]|nr:hypothetical protein [Mollicutes bacterium]
MNSYSYGGNNLVHQQTGILVWTILSIVFAIVGGFLVYFLFVKSDKKYSNKFVNWLKDFLDFNNLLLETIIKISYLILALYITLFSFGLIGQSFFLFLGVLVIGNVVIRVIYEFSILMIKICKDVSQINRKLKKDKES